MGLAGFGCLWVDVFGVWWVLAGVGAFAGFVCGFVLDVGLMQYTLGFVRLVLVGLCGLQLCWCVAVSLWLVLAGAFGLVDVCCLWLLVVCWCSDVAFLWERPVYFRFVGWAI